MPFVHGKVSVFKLDNGSGSLQDLSAYCDSVDFPQTIETAEVTTFGDNSKEYIVGLADATLSVSGSWDATLDAHMEGVLAAQRGGTLASATFEYGPAGGAGGAVRYTGECILTGYTGASSVGDKVTFSAEFQVTGAVTRNTF
jgi:hypothetical protein